MVWETYKLIKLTLLRIHSLEVVLTPLKNFAVSDEIERLVNHLHY